MHRGVNSIYTSNPVENGTNHKSMREQIRDWILANATRINSIDSMILLYVPETGNELSDCLQSVYYFQISRLEIPFIMPEIAEVRVDADLLDFYLNNRQLQKIEDVTGLFMNKCKGLEELNANLPLTVEWVKSRAKKIFIKLTGNMGDSQDWYIFITYGMTGGITHEPSKHCHLEFTLSEDWMGFNTFYYRDSRRIGSFIASCDPNEYTTQVTTMAKPFVLGYSHPDFLPITKGEFVENLKTKGRRKYLISALDNQRSIGSGLGNYLLSECLYDAEIDPWIHCHELSEVEIGRLFDSIVKVVSLAYAYNGNSISDYYNINGEKGTFGSIMKVYSKAGKLDSMDREILSAKAPHGRTVFYVEY